MVDGKKFIASPLFFLFLPFLYFFGPYKKKMKVRVGKQTVNAYVADNVFSRAIGYMFRDKRDVKRNEGILFVFDSPHTVSFWMLDVHFPVRVTSLDDKSSVVMQPHSLRIYKMRGKLFLEQKTTQRRE